MTRSWYTDRPGGSPFRAAMNAAGEAERLRIRPGAIRLTITRTYRTSEQPVETADIVLPVERYALVYEIPVT